MFHGDVYTEGKREPRFNEGLFYSTRYLFRKGAAERQYHCFCLKTHRIHPKRYIMYIYSIVPYVCT